MIAQKVGPVVIFKFLNLKKYMKYLFLSFKIQRALSPNIWEYILFSLYQHILHTFLAIFGYMCHLQKFWSSEIFVNVQKNGLNAIFLQENERSSVEQL